MRYKSEDKKRSAAMLGKERLNAQWAEIPVQHHSCHPAAAVQKLLGPSRSSAGEDLTFRDTCPLQFKTIYSR